MTAVGIGLWKKICIFRLYDLFYLIGGESVAADRNTRTGVVSLTQLLCEVYENIRTAPLTRMHAAQKIDRRTAVAAAFSDFQRMTETLFPSLVRQLD